MVIFPNYDSDSWHFKHCLDCESDNLEYVIIDAIESGRQLPGKHLGTRCKECGKTYAIDRLPDLGVMPIE